MTNLSSSNVIDYCLILAAGHGRRMGTIGEHLPKPLWPLFEKNLLEIQLLYLENLFKNLNMPLPKIFINTHHHHKKIENFILKSRFNKFQITIHYEPQLIDIGGAIHFLAQKKDIEYSGNLLILNSDQFLFFDPEMLKITLKKNINYTTSLFGILIDKNVGHNQLILNDKQELHKIKLNKDIFHNETDIITYSGISLINLSKLKRVEIDKPLPFFKYVANYEEYGVHVSLFDSFEYLDFGTLHRYGQTVLKLIESFILTKNPNTKRIFNSHFSQLVLNFFIKHNIIVSDKIPLNGTGYNEYLINNIYNFDSSAKKFNKLLELNLDNLKYIFLLKEGNNLSHSFNLIQAETVISESPLFYFIYQKKYDSITHTNLNEI